MKQRIVKMVDEFKEHVSMLLASFPNETCHEDCIYGEVCKKEKCYIQLDSKRADYPPEVRKVYDDLINND